MGVSGCGKSEVGQQLATALGARFIDADSLHPPENVAKMAAKIPLTDADRWPWLDRVKSVAINGAGQTVGTATETTTVLACSALKRIYRNHLRQDTAVDVVFVYLQGSFDLILSRLNARQGHFMPLELLRSQFATLEEPGPDEAGVLTVDISGSVAKIVASIRAELAD